MHSMDKVDENLVVEGPVAASVPLKHHPNLFDELRPILDLQLPTIPRYMEEVQVGGTTRWGTLIHISNSMAFAYFHWLFA